jgi:beta-xylosidase
VRDGRQPLAAKIHEYLAIRVGRVRSVMNSYTDIDGIPVASDPRLLTEVLRDAWGFTGTVVSDYGAVTFLELMHRIAGSEGEAADPAGEQQC